MALMKFGRSCFSITSRNVSSELQKIQPVKRQFTLGQVRMVETEKNLDSIRVDGLSKIALVIDGKYKKLKDVPVFLPYGHVYRARDKLRIKASVASSIFIIILVIYHIRKNQRLKRQEEYYLLMDQQEEAAMQKKK